jgi:histidine triad (HIT) family protein
MSNCIFCQIIKRQVGAKYVFEDDHVIAFEPSDPVARGHALVVPKHHRENLVDITIESLNEVISVAKLVAIECMANLGATGVNLLHASGEDAQQSIDHFHLHVVPRYPNDGLDLWLLRRKTGEGE